MFKKFYKLFTALNIYLHKIIISYWYKTTFKFFYWLFYPLELTYKAIVLLRAALYQSKALKVRKFQVPIIVVGNLTVGGTGKTNIVYYLVKHLQQSGHSPGVIMRGYKVKQHEVVTMVTKGHEPEDCGDEPVMLARKLACPIVVGKNKVKNVEFLLARHADVDVIICDDGLQHYALGRDIEILLIDGDRYFGNLHHLPLGPLRENINRIYKVDFIMINRNMNKFAATATTEQNLLLANFGAKVPVKAIQHKLYNFVLQPTKIVNICKPYIYADPKNFATVHAIAGIGNNQKFFSLLNFLGIDTINHDFPDHHYYKDIDLVFGDDFPIIMTEKDAIKCRKFANNNFWYLEIEPVLNLDEQFKQSLAKLLNSNK